MIGDLTVTDNGDMQPEVKIDSDTSLFTQPTDPFKLECIAEILRLIKIGTDISLEEQQQIIALVAEFANCFALSVHEVIPIPGAEHQMSILVNSVFPRKIAHQKPLSENQ